jgi:hypothetical protein
VWLLLVERKGCDLVGQLIADCLVRFDANPGTLT